MFVKAIMTQPVLQIRNDATLQEAAELVARAASNALVVVDATGRFVGMIAAETILAALLPDTNEVFALGGSVDDAHAVFLQKSSRAAQRSIQPFIRTALTILRPDSHIGEAALIFADQPYCSLPVMVQGTLLGIVTRAAVCRAATRGQQPLHQLAHGPTRRLWHSTSRRCREWLGSMGERLRLPQAEPARETA